MYIHYTYFRWNNINLVPLQVKGLQFHTRLECYWNLRNIIVSQNQLKEKGKKCNQFHNYDYIVMLNCLRHVYDNGCQFWHE